ncbi:ROK family protein [Hafnia alvei]|uniref:Fructokinase n=1 Tax=Hafnia alvei TaxID=569 RepID=A0A1C6Z058_HAFAL|nr:ROK family protein [Hafnia alvei]SCM52502.1 fructokinase [Hafnia alvei]
MLNLGLDIGGTKTEAVMLDQQGKILFTQRIATDKSSYSGFLTTITQLIETIRSDFKNEFSIGICLPGTEDRETKLFKNSNILVLNQQPLISDLEKHLQQKIGWDNDANCFALSESIDGAGRYGNSVFGAILGTGCGGGLTVNQQLLRGHNGNGGEWGHNPLPGYHPQRDGAPATCYCGQMNCTESFISGTGLANRFSLVTNIESGSAAEFFQRVHKQDAEALTYFALYQDQLARALASVVNIFDPDVIILGGGLSQVELIYQGLTDKIGQYIFNTSFNTPVKMAQHGDSSGVRGAAWIGRQAH